MTHLRRRTFAQRALALAALSTVPGLPALAQTQTQTQTQTPAAPLAPLPASLFAQNIPPVPQALVDQMAAYTEFRGHGFADWHPTRAARVRQLTAAKPLTLSIKSVT